MGGKATNQDTINDNKLSKLLFQQHFLLVLINNVKMYPHFSNSVELLLLLSLNCCTSDNVKQGMVYTINKDPYTVSDDIVNI